MSFVDRTYPDIVRDILTNLTQGVTQEVHRITYDPLARPVQVPPVVLKQRPVRRVSLVRGFISSGDEGAERVPYTFSLNDYELVPDSTDPRALNTIRFLPFGTKPAPDTDVIVNYYPRNTDPAPITDLNVGSVARTLVEALSKELAVLYTQLNLAYESGFVETATGSSLDRVVALLNYQRFRAGRPAGTVTFRRRTGTLGNITIPSGTPITDAADKIRYETIDSYTMLAGESIAQVRVRGASAATPAVEAGVLTVVQRAIAGIDSVVNERATTRATNDETDDELRSRVRGALLASNKGTLDAITQGLLQLPQVRAVKLDEMPNGVPGEIRLSISLTESAGGDGTLPLAVLERIEELRPAGIRVVGETAHSITLQAQVQLVLAGSFQPPSVIESIHGGVKATLVSLIGKKGVGEKIRVRPLVAALLADERIVDAVITLGAEGGAAGTPGADFVPAGDTIVQLAADDISFAADTFDQALPVAGQPVMVEVRALIAVTLITGVPIASARTQLTARLTDFFGRIAPGSAIDSVALLTALRDDAKYSIDPLRLQVTLTSPDQFVQIVQGGPAFTAQPNQRFNVIDVEVTA